MNFPISFHSKEIRPILFVEIGINGNPKMQDGLGHPNQAVQISAKSAKKCEV